MSLIANDTDADNDALAATAGTFATDQGGSIVITTNGAYTYTPGPDFNGADTVSYTVVDDGGLSDTGTLTITVGAVNDAPVLTLTTSASPASGKKATRPRATRWSNLRRLMPKARTWT